MLAKERHALIMEILEKDRIIYIADIAKRFSVSNETARRDLEHLQDTHAIKRIYGGAVLLEGAASAAPSSSSKHMARSYQSHSQKVSIGKVAAGLIRPGETVILDVGTTTLELARNLKDINGLTVLTNSLPVVNELAGTPVTVYCLGGKLNSNELSMNGKIVLDALQLFFVDKAFIGAGGITLDGGISDYNGEEGQVRQAIIRRASQTIVVADSAKFGTNSFASVCSLEDVDVIVTDENLSEDFQADIRKQYSHLELILAPAGEEETDE